MGFAVWMDGEKAWAAGTYEYRAMGVAVIAKTDLFCGADFRRDRLRPRGAAFHGHFASIGHVNAYLISKRRPAGIRMKH